MFRGVGELLGFQVGRVKNIREVENVLEGGAGE